MIKEKVIAGTEMILLLVSMFALSYTIDLNNGFFERLNKPMIPIVSASGDGLAGCCSLKKNGDICSISTDAECADNATFAEGQTCDETHVCKRICCYDESTGNYDSNVLESDCEYNESDDQNCNLPGNKLGCCVLGSTTSFVNRKQCEIATRAFGAGDGADVNWSGNLNEGQCTLLASAGEEGACVIGDGNCKFVTAKGCVDYKGKFYLGELCTNPELKTNCKRTRQTNCVDGKDGVYFIDSCGNPANIYDASKIDDVPYWSHVVKPEDSCGAGDGNANSKECGNCNRFLGGICASAPENGFDAKEGNNYCKDTSCLFKGKSYKDGESWCVYDSDIESGNNVVGSGSWKYVCNQGSVQVTPCADYRNQICIQSNAPNTNGDGSVFRSASCVANNWRECISLNSEDDGMKKCADALNCEVKTIDLADHFKFDTCMPKYPGGFQLRGEGAEVSAATVCGMATMNCTVVRKPHMFRGGCKTVVNKGCLKPNFVAGMNDFCNSLGDCGGTVNIAGKYVKNYNVKRDDGGTIYNLSQEEIEKLVDSAKSVPGQHAKVEDYSEYLKSAGVIGTDSDGNDIVMNVGAGVSGIILAGYSMGVFGSAATGLYASYPTLASGITSVGNYFGVETASITGAPAGAALAPFAGATMGAAIGAMVGGIIAKKMGVSPGGTMLMEIGGGIAGAAIGYGAIGGAAGTTGAAAGTAGLSSGLGGGAIGLGLTPLGWVVVGALVVVTIASFFGGSKCDPIVVQFECKPWQPPANGNDCEKCNDNPLEPCSEYRCESLGAACEMVGVGTEREMCASSVDDGIPPVISANLDLISDGLKYSDVGTSGFKVTSKDGGCVQANSLLTFGIKTDKLAQCKFDTKMKDFSEMNYDFGGNFFKHNHTTAFTLPDPSHGESHGIKWAGNLSLYAKCIDTHGNKNPTFYTIKMCVNQGEDKWPPRFTEAEPANGSLVGFENKNQNVKIVTNELSDCKWDVDDVNYSSMANFMNCNDEYGKGSSLLGYVCSDNFPTPNADNKYYIRCMDQPWLAGTKNESKRNANIQSFVYELKKPKKKIQIDWIKPDEDFSVGTEMTTVNFEIKTSGGGNDHTCSYSFSGYGGKMIELFDSHKVGIHKQSLNRPAGDYNFYAKCHDETGDSVENMSSFKIIFDDTSPEVARVWQKGKTLNIITPEDAECKYSLVNCNFNWDSGVSAGSGKKHTIEVGKSRKYYIKCKDKLGNLPDGCSISVKSL